MLYISESSMIGMAWTRYVDPSNAKDKIGKGSGIFIFSLVIQDHIESIRKSIQLKWDEMLLNGLLAQSA